jgi:NAD-dependent deacetylase
MSEIEQLAALVRERQPCVVLTGAGISTESGIPDFRSPDGVWAQFDPMEYATIDAFHEDPEKVWRFYAPRYSMLASAEPNAAHRALVELERGGHVAALITQNIDMLHERAGSPGAVEVHGSIRESHCLRCDTTYTLAQVVQLLATSEAPRCPTCDSVLKPGVVMFGELLPQEPLDRSFALARGAALLLVVGSALEVQPVAVLPWETRQGGGVVAIVNLGPSAFDDHATLKIDGKAGEILPALALALA